MNRNCIPKEPEFRIITRTGLVILNRRGKNRRGRFALRRLNRLLGFNRRRFE
ncbi:hypothetical protein HanRHA438_Chr10g0453841 [Helianthus annuus]|nr:hypothetical protein HanRHA438_Chr10g0453841 [Helianthus annuus]